MKPVTVMVNLVNSCTLPDAMRDDMPKVLVERPRCVRGFRRGARKGYHKELSRTMGSDDGPRRREGIKVRSGGEKHFNEHLSPLRRYLDSQVGRPWSLIYSEICRHVDRGNVVQKHILTHLFQYVETQPILIANIVCHPPHRWYRTVPITGRHAWYVCPKSGLLRRAPRHRIVPRSVPPRHWLGSRQFCERRSGGEWILVTVAPLTPPPKSVYDVYLRSTFHRHSLCELQRTYGGRTVYATGLSVLTTPQLRRLPVEVLRGGEPPRHHLGLEPIDHQCRPHPQEN